VTDPDQARKKRADMARDPVQDAEIEIVCSRCGYRMSRTPSRLRRGTPLACPQCGEQILPTPPDRDQAG